MAGRPIGERLGLRTCGDNADPDLRYKIFFARAEFSHVAANSTTPGLASAQDGNNTTQTRAVLEAGIIF
jgi:hypothetical protein